MAKITSEEIRRILDEYDHRFKEEERRGSDRIRDFINRASNPFSKSNLKGQITASAVPVRLRQKDILFIWHGTLQRWLQPGGHVEPADASLEAAALRELLEETELDKKCIRNTGAAPLIDLDIHQIPENSTYPAHWHYDFRFVFEIHPDSVLHLRHRWIPANELKDWEDPSISRYAAKVDAYLGNPNSIRT